MSQLERRFRPFTEFRAKKDSDTIVGHAATFNDVYDVAGMFDERIAPGAFDDAVHRDDVRALFNHDPNHVLGRTSAGTLRIKTDKVGLHSEIDLPKSATMLREAIERKDVTEMSFGFTVEEDEWEVTDEESGRELRTITKIGTLYDVSPVTFPANPNTDVAMRSRQEWRQGTQTHDTNRVPEFEGPVMVDAEAIADEIVERLRPERIAHDPNLNEKMRLIEADL